MTLLARHWCVQSWKCSITLDSSKIADDYAELIIRPWLELAAFSIIALLFGAARFARSIYFLLGQRRPFLFCSTTGAALIYITYCFFLKSFVRADAANSYTHTHARARARTHTHTQIYIYIYIYMYICIYEIASFRVNVSSRVSQ